MKYVRHLKYETYSRFNLKLNSDDCGLLLCAEDIIIIFLIIPGLAQLCQCLVSLKKLLLAPSS